MSDYDFAASYKETDVNLYLAELNFITPIMFDILKLGLDINYKGSKLNGEFEKMHYDGDMLGVRASIKDFEGFGLSYAYTTVSDGDELIFGVGFGPGSYTSLPIRGPFVYTGYAGMDTHKAALDYDFEKIGAKGLKANFQYSRGDQDAPKHRAGHTPAGQNSRIKGFSTGVKYAVASVKGLNFGVTYTSLNKKFITRASNTKISIKTSFGCSSRINSTSARTGCSIDLSSLGLEFARIIYRCRNLKFII